MPTRVTLIRHGRTKWNAERRYMGSTDIALDETGLAQADKLRMRFKSEAIDKVYSSDSIRAFNFAEIVFCGMKVEKMTSLREMDFGVIEGMTYEEIIKKYPDVYGEWLSDLHSGKIPGGESVASLKARVLGALNMMVAANKGKSLAVVTHAGPIRVIINEITRSGNFWDVMPGSASVNVIEYSGGVPRIVSINDTSHLLGGVDG